MMPNQKLAETMIKVLRHWAINYINFEMHGLKVEPLDFVAVRMAIEYGQITCEVGIPANPHQTVGAGHIVKATYVAADDQIRFPDESWGINKGSERLTIIHEATHAAFDLKYNFHRGDRPVQLYDECAAVLAAALVFRRARSNDGDMQDERVFCENCHDDLARRLADKMIAVQGKQWPIPVYAVKDEEITELKAAVSQAWDLSGSETSVYDGVHPWDKMPTWVNGWWSVNEGGKQSFYHFDLPHVVSTKVKPANGSFTPSPQTPEKRGRVTGGLVNGPDPYGQKGVNIVWSPGGALESFRQVSTTEMRSLARSIVAHKITDGKPVWIKVR